MKPEYLYHIGFQTSHFGGSQLSETVLKFGFPIDSEERLSMVRKSIEDGTRCRVVITGISLLRKIEYGRSAKAGYSRPTNLLHS
jgi:hypothetical protein